MQSTLVPLLNLKISLHSLIFVFLSKQQKQYHWQDHHCTGAEYDLVLKAFQYESVRKYEYLTERSCNLCMLD